MDRIHAGHVEGLLLWKLKESGHVFPATRRVGLTVTGHLNMALLRGEVVGIAGLHHC